MVYSGDRNNETGSGIQTANTRETRTSDQRGERNSRTKANQYTNRSATKDYCGEVKVLERKQQLKEQITRRANDENDGETRALAKPQAVKLQRYTTITPFEGDYKVWFRFWNQFSVEVDGSSMAEISKFNHLLELVIGKPKEDILGLPHSTGYAEAKKYLWSPTENCLRCKKLLLKT